MLICGLQRLSLLDFPGKLAATIFTGGCNLRCPFCHNALLVTRVPESVILTEREVFAFLEKRRGILDGVCITGGEPLLQNDLRDFILGIRKLGFLIKLDTNGTFPEKLYPLISDGLIDYVALDIKNSPEKYPLTVGLPAFDPTPVFQSAAMLMNGSVPYEFRTTLVRGLHSREDIENIGALLNGAKNFYLQNFEDSGDLVGFADSGAQTGLSGFSAAELEEFKRILEKYAASVSIRN